MSLSAPDARTPLRVWIERLVTGAIAIVALFVPLLIGLLFYLALTDGIVINENDPAREIRLWMVRETRGATGLALSVSAPTNLQARSLCAFTYVTFLKWDRSVRIETADRYCRCFERQGNQYIDTKVVCP